ncbi:MAG: AMP-binding protein [Acidobacteria bacterium]|nr:AMP-binding protein [Acidobacteriota bacterium]
MQSSARGPSSLLLDTTIGDQLSITAARDPDREALVSCHQRVRLTWGELDERVTHWACGLLGLGLVPGDRVGVWSPNCWEWAVLQLACARAGLVLVNVNPAYRSHELSYVIRKSRMRALFLWESDHRANYRNILSQTGAEPEWTVYFEEGREYWRAAGELPGPLDCHDAVNIQYTSGTTGSPKGVLLTHHNILNNGLLVGRQMRITAQDRICVPVPLYHCFGCVMGVLACVAHGSTLVLPNWTFDARATLDAIHQERATAVYGVPAMFIAELEHPEFARFDVASLRTGIMAGAPCPVEVMRRVVDQMHCREMTIAYGQTESSPVITMSGAGDDLEVRVSTVGAALAETEVKIADRDNGSTVERGVQGELCTRGYLVMRGYDGEAEATAKAIDADGWLHTGDLAVMREDGNCKITGRAKDMIIRGGENVYPREIEEFLYTNPKIADVHVVGVPDLRLGECISAWVRLRADAEMTEEELREFCRGRIAHFKVPKYIRFVDGFPMTVTGKIQKFKMREEEIQRLGLEEAARVATA